MKHGDDTHARATAPPASPSHQDQSYPTIVLIADGWTQSTFLSLLESGGLPEIADGLVKPGGLITDVVSNLPSVSVASHASILTSSYQDDHGLPGHRWLATDSLSARNYLRARGPKLANADLSVNVKTIFECHPGKQTVSVQGIITRGADKIVRLASMNSRIILKATARAVLADPDSVVVAWLPRGDALAHIHGPDSSQVKSDMITTSRAIGEFIECLDRHGLLDAARIVMVPDHGHRAVSRSVDLNRIAAEVGVNLNMQVNPRNVRGLPAAFTSGDSAAYVYLDKSRKERRFDLASALSAHPSLELICWTDESGIWFAGHPGIGVAVIKTPLSARYEVVSGADPLELFGSTGPHEIDFSRPPGAAEKYPDIIHQFWRSHIEGRSGDLLLTAGDDVHFGLGPRLGWRLGFHRGSHGGPSRSEMLVSAVYRGVNVTRPATVRSADLLGVLGLMGVTNRDARLLACSH